MKFQDMDTEKFFLNNELGEEKYKSESEAKQRVNVEQQLERLRSDLEYQKNEYEEKLGHKELMISEKNQETQKLRVELKNMKEELFEKDNLIETLKMRISFLVKKEEEIIEKMHQRMTIFEYLKQKNELQYQLKEAERKQRQIEE